MSLAWNPFYGGSLADATCETLSSRKYCSGYNICKGMSTFYACGETAEDMTQCFGSGCAMLCPMMMMLMMEEDGEGYELDILSEE